MKAVALVARVVQLLQLVLPLKQSVVMVAMVVSVLVMERVALVVSVELRKRRALAPL